MDKNKVLALVRDSVASHLDTVKASIEKTRKQAIEAPSAMESKSDTTKAQMSRVADVLQGAYETNQQALNELDSLIANPPNTTRVANYSLVEVKDSSGCKEVFFILPAGGGDTYEIDGEEVTIISSGSPLATALIGHRTGEVIMMKTPNGSRALSIISIS